MPTKSGTISLFAMVRRGETASHHRIFYAPFQPETVTLKRVFARQARNGYNARRTAGRQILAKPRQDREVATVGEFLWVFRGVFQPTHMRRLLFIQISSVTRKARSPAAPIHECLRPRQDHPVLPMSTSAPHVLLARRSVAYRHIRARNRSGQYADDRA